MWDAKRQVIWLATGITLGSVVFYQDAFDENGRFDARYFLLLELLLVAVIGAMFYIYSRKK